MESGSRTSFTDPCTTSWVDLVSHRDAARRLTHTPRIQSILRTWHSLIGANCSNSRFFVCLPSGMWWCHVGGDISCFLVLLCFLSSYMDIFLTPINFLLIMFLIVWDKNDMIFFKVILNKHYVRNLSRLISWN